MLSCAGLSRGALRNYWVSAALLRMLIALRWEAMSDHSHATNVMHHLKKMAHATCSCDGDVGALCDRAS